MGYEMSGFLAKHRFAIAVTAINLAIVTTGVIIHVTLNNRSSGLDSQDKYPLLSKRIFTENQNDLIINFNPLRTVLNDYLDLHEANNLGIYFEYLPSGSSLGINDEVEVKIASLIKLPIVMAVYRSVEEGKLSLDQKIVLQQSDINKDYGDLWKRGAGSSLTIREAIELSLTKSDNTAQMALKRQLDNDDIQSVLSELNIPLDLKEDDGEVYLFVSPKNYTSVLRSLYLSSYLTKEHSNEILDLLSKNNFNGKLDAGVPDSVTVAHKTGTFRTDRDVSEHIFTDCGIVYAKNRPYALCLRTIGMPEADAETHMANVSSLIYSYIDSVN